MNKMAGHRTNILHRFISGIAGSTLLQCLVMVVCWIFLRVFLEGVLESHHFIGFSPFSYKMLLTYFVHFPLFYLNLFLLLIIIISALVNEPISRVTKVASVGLGAIILVPIIDWFINRGYMITYPLRLESYFVNFLNPHVSLSDIGVSPGQRIAIILISLLVAIYGYLKTRSYLRGCCLFLLSLSVIVVFGGLTTLVAANRPEHVYVTGGILYTDTQKYCALYLLLFTLLVFVYLSIFSRKFLKLIFNTLRLERMFFYGGMVIFGLAISIIQKRVGFHASVFNYLGLVSLFLGISIGFWGLQVFNDIFDIDIDRITGKKNLLLHGVTLKYYNAFWPFLIVLALCYALIISFQAFLILTAYLLLGVIYSLPPVRLKRIPVISTLTIAVAVCFSIAFGFSVCYGGQALHAIPGRVLMPTLIAVTLGFSAKDIGHVEGDRAQGVITLPVLMYDRRNLTGRIPMAILVSVSYVVYMIFIPQMAPGALFCAFCTFFYILFTEKPNETFLFIMLYVYGAYLFYTLYRLMQ